MNPDRPARPDRPGRPSHDRPSHDPSRDRHSRDDELRAELAALDELLRQPAEAERPSAPADFTVAETVELVGPSRDRVKAAPDPARPSSDSVRPASERARPSSERATPSNQPAAGPSRVRTEAVSDRVRRPRDRTLPLRDRGRPSLERMEPSRDLAVPSRATELMRAPDAAAPRREPRRLRVAALWVGALTIGLLAGGLLGWWHAVNPPVDTPSVESTTRPEPAPASAPAGKAKARGPSRSARPATAAPPRTAPTVPTAPNAAPPAAVPPGGGAPGNVSLPATKTTSDAGAIVGSISSAPAPAIDLPLPSAPLKVTPSMPPTPPPATAAAAGGVAAAMVAADQAAIETTLRRYEDAYERLDAKAAVEVWPSVDQRALARAFAGLASQTLNIRGCEVVVRAGASTATASCSGTAEYVRKVGDARVRVEPRQWTFTLNKTQGAWRIAAVDGSR